MLLAVFLCMRSVWLVVGGCCSVASGHCQLLVVFVAGGVLVVRLLSQLLGCCHVCYW